MKCQSDHRRTSLARVCQPDRIVAFSRRLRFALAVVLPVVLIGCVHPPKPNARLKEAVRASRAKVRV